MVAAPAGPYTFARAQKIIVYIVTLPFNALVKNFREDNKAGSASFFWKYPLFVGAACYPIGYYRHERVRINEKRDLLALGIKTQYDNDVASGKIIVEED